MTKLWPAHDVGRGVIVVGALQTTEVDEVGVDPRDVGKFLFHRVGVERARLDERRLLDVPEVVLVTDPVGVVDEPQRPRIR
jgi:hypothetical protein